MHYNRHGREGLQFRNCSPQPGSLTGLGRARRSRR
jgi:hypothetical protein